MNAKYSIAVLALSIGMCVSATAQASAGAPAGSTGQCNDGSFTSVATKTGACRGHKGVKTWFAANAPASKPSAKSTHASKRSTASAAATTTPPAAAKTSAAAGGASTRGSSSPSKAARASTAAQAPGGGPGIVWVNTASNVYHCSGSNLYGKTKAGKYMTEAQARAAGAHPDHGKGCGL